ncbi:hypothetical protein H4R33_004425 [Dimargaris cristalligena]|uniref:Major facilitator superfamily domain-containing protein n=1 Tax=Dimargaris cristalligena TaxID=215637 RepID=A0A4P9ZYN8_9FUNG|nr:hypothetical protein H4R33_004425 [Dimargaris cristalligena]RKP37890.1 major facilitator superfamily domain-containing protein [Dimargaris cristalligena]|eukprot:RKP37890.1 major facilitator superfamily domain-containing protein [Dimargaris cristalligena]
MAYSSVNNVEPGDSENSTVRTGSPAYLVTDMKLEADGDPTRFIATPEATSEKPPPDLEGSPLEIPLNNPGEPPPMSTGKLIIIMIGLCLGTFLAFVDITIVATALPIIGAQLRAFYEITWVTTSYLLTSTALRPLYGKFSDIFGRVPVILFALVTFLVGCAICGAAQNIMMLIIARGLAGIGGAGLVSLSYIIISDMVPLDRRALFLGAFSAMFAIASIAGPLLGGVFADYVSWRWVFYINLPIGAVTLLVILFAIRMPYPKGSILNKLGKIDYLGTFLLVAGTTFVLLAILWGGKDYPWNDKRIISFFCVGFALIILFILAEMFIVAEPVVPMSLFRYRNIYISFTGVFFLGVAIMGTVFYLPIFFNVVHNDSATMAGVKLLPFMLSMVAGNFISAALIQKSGRCREIVWVGTVIATVGAGLLTTLSRDSSVGHEVGYTLIFGLGMGLYFQTMLMICQSTAEASEVAIVTACYNFFEAIGATLGLAIISAIMNNVLTTRLALIPGLDLAALSASPADIYTMDVSEETRSQFIDAYVKAISTALIPVIPMMGVTFLLSLAYKHIPLQSK